MALACPQPETPDQEKVFAVRFGELKRWSVNSFFEIEWEWPSENIHALGKALQRRIEEDNGEDENARLVTLRFDGTMEPRAQLASDIKGSLFRARSNDIVYSRIDVRNGAIGVVPENLPYVAVTAEFPVYVVRPEVALPDYIQLLVRTPQFLMLINSLISGASGRKRVQPFQLEELKVPLPPLDVQRAIVDKWHEAQREFRTGIEAIEIQRQASDKRFLAELGLELPEDVPRRRVMAIPFEAVDRWDLTSAQRVGRERLISHWEEKPLSEIVLPLSQTNARLVPASKPEEHWNYIGMENVEAQSGRLVDFAPRLGAEVISASVVFDANSVLYGKLRPYLRKVIVPADYDLKEGVASSEFLNFKPREGVDIRFLATFLRSALVADYASQSTGGRMPRVAPETLLDIPVPLPPIETQREIVARLHTAQSDLEAQRQKLRSDLEAARIEVENRILGRLQMP